MASQPASYGLKGGVRVIDVSSDAETETETNQNSQVQDFDLYMPNTTYLSYPEYSESINKSNYSKQFSSVKQYEDEWNELYNNHEIDLEILKQKSTEGQLRTSHFRSICWRCLLGILHKQPKEWLCQLQTYRKHYNEVCVELEQNPWNVKENNPYDNPLSQESDSIWQKYFCDEELKSVVHQDVKRTFPGMDFFRKKEIQQMMVRILFCYARQNPTLCYRQGMHEILAPLIFILHCDHQAFLHAKEQQLLTDKVIDEILSPEHLEQDAFSIFKFIMNHIECSYRINNVMTTSAGYFPVETESYDIKICQNEVISRLDNIKNTILRLKDPELSQHLEKLDIPLHLFGIRWLRLLFGREFPLQDLLVLWDFIFANNFETVNYIVVAMLIAIRHTILDGDYTECLSNLMRYPSGVDVMYVIEYALHLKDPQKFRAPDFALISSLPKNNENQKNVNCSSPNQRLRKSPTKQTQRPSDKSNLLLPRQLEEDDGNVIRGYAINDPNLVKEELEQIKMVLNIVRHKLVQYHSTLSANLRGDSSPDVLVVLDGMYELSSLLKNYSRENTCEIETACEAGEIKEAKSPTHCLKKETSVGRIQSQTTSINSESRSHTLPKVKKGPKSGELTVFKQHIGSDSVSGAPMTDPLRLIKNPKLEETLQCK